MIDKKSLRREFRELRREMTREQRLSADRQIAERFLHCREYRSCDILLCYVSFDIEVDTYEIIQAALKDGKQVFAPKCSGTDNTMVFLRIYSFNDLSRGAFGISEPEGGEAFSGDKALCVVPALSFDMSGGRLGFGAGFYDRFLCENPSLFRLGLCYDSCISDVIPTEPHDIPMQKIITENNEIEIKDKRKDG